MCDPTVFSRDLQNTDIDHNCLSHKDKYDVLQLLGFRDLVCSYIVVFFPLLAHNFK